MTARRLAILKSLPVLLLSSCINTKSTLEAVENLAVSVKENSNTLTALIADESVKWRELLAFFLEALKPLAASAFASVENFFSYLKEAVGGERVSKTQTKLDWAITTGTYALGVVAFVVLAIGVVIVHHKLTTKKRHQKVAAVITKS